MLPTSREAPLCDAIFHVENAHSIQALGSTPTSSSPVTFGPKSALLLPRLLMAK
ncbi:hypothetical protein MCOR27_002547 [Pyricularia oryzae]|uniref:Uncharacterized protein n=1 Tax=Pyricularia grisea TaxID=148305 RepID=A0ABQ8P090_PYRGI|nr:hypothetical protein MCOR01_010276 [Pyricularia oryzae]KAI6304135.1 hypothetical protein MCOR33_000882 [Pyricularia grisea]KAH9436382.1 hypothetical protein MCOR02_000053 [Pyricularia oryzae]KAI6279852.1 hypothetical protein MCOR26_003980 [Pyricularia oryzae]KAI6284785.1 hypothetical protein MCOR27_002547 [Pyricularia oryzae]